MHRAFVLAFAPVLALLGSGCVDAADPLDLKVLFVNQGAVVEVRYVVTAPNGTEVANESVGVNPGAVVERHKPLDSRENHTIVFSYDRGAGRKYINATIGSPDCAEPVLTARLLLELGPPHPNGFRSGSASLHTFCGDRPAFETGAPVFD